MSEQLIAENKHEALAIIILRRAVVVARDVGGTVEERAALIRAYVALDIELGVHTGLPK